ncbi:MAG: SIS domain-containing protein [Deltaproteobacteria bacterium]|nr:SIS domain-containing protein [Deltaproteobacteria bacterium]
MKEMIFRMIRFLGRWRLYIGRDPEGVPGDAVILFPLLPTVFFCGFAGLLNIRRSSVPETEGFDRRLGRLFDRILAKDMESLLIGTIAAEEYLEGPATLKEMADVIFLMKRRDACWHLLSRSDRITGLADLEERMRSFLSRQENLIEERAGYFPTGDMEIVSSRLVALKDVQWDLRKDILDNLDRILSLARVDSACALTPEGFEKYSSLNFLLNCLDRLEVRGRDSAGIQLNFTVADHDALSDTLEKITDEGKGLFEEYQRRTRPSDLHNGSIHVSTGSAKTADAAPDPGSDRSLAFTYKTSSVIGELGKNVKTLRETIASDGLLREMAGLPTLFQTAFAHTRWASVGSITEENCHPIDNYTPNRAGVAGAEQGQVKNYPRYGSRNWFISAILNGDIDNYRSLRDALEKDEALIAPEVTTDTKVIPLLIEKHLLAGHDLTESFRLALNEFEGSHAIAVISDVEPGKVFLALRGSGQAIYVGIAPDQYLFSSELYGLVEGTPLFLKMDGEKPSPSGKDGTNGQIYILDRQSAGGPEGIRAFYYDGTPITLREEDLQRAEITTRDIDRGSYDHYFLKEITESTQSVRKTLRGKYRIARSDSGAEKVVFNLGRDIVPESIRDGFVSGRIRRILVIGHGTAAVAGQAVADAMNRYLAETPLRIESMIASELSGFLLRQDLSDSLVIPITQSGTTTDTNRAVAMAAQRGARIIAIVNRRQSDITGKAEGVFYTSDGRDIEMSVASTKAFYSQIVAGHVLALYLAQLLGSLPESEIVREIRNLEKAPEMMQRVLERKDVIRECAEQTARQRLCWAVVGSGPNKAASDEIRIKLSELCYKTLSTDVVENKKHIDLSAEPLIIVCASGSPETVTADLLKDVAIFKAHKAAVIVFADEGEDRFGDVADFVVPIPRTNLPLPVILNTLAGHLWGYFAACAIDGDALYLREFRSELSARTLDQRTRPYPFFDRQADRSFRRLIGEFSRGFNQRRDRGDLSFVGVKTLSDLVLLLKYATGKLPMEDFWDDFHEADDLTTPVDLLDVTIGRAIDELSRPIDAIRHQAKTVTVGTSRKEQPLTGPVFDLIRELGFSERSLISRNVLAMVRVQPAIAGIKGYTLYSIDKLDSDGLPGEDTMISIVKKTGVSLTMPSRTEGSPVLMGTKRTIMAQGNFYVGLGKSDGASIVMVPLTSEAAGSKNLLLIHVEFDEAMPLEGRKNVLGDRLGEIRNLVNEFNLVWDDRYLEKIPLGILFGEPVEIIAGRIKQFLAGGDANCQI